MKNNKNIQLIVVLVATFLITNGTFFVLCEKDTILDTINRVGDWTNAILWHSSKAFLFYAGADSFYNIRYLVPKVANYKGFYLKCLIYRPKHRAKTSLEF